MRACLLTTPSRGRRGVCLGGAVLAAAAGLGCGPQFPPAWRIAPDPVEAGGAIDPDGKLRVLAITADPPEAAPGARVALQALVVTHPQHGEVVQVDGQSVRTPAPRGLSTRWLSCRVADPLLPPVPCGLTREPPLDLQTLPSSGSGSGPATELLAAELAALPYSLLVTLIAADQAFPGGAEACFAQAAAGGSVSPDPNHCVIAVKRVKIARSAAPNRNPAIAGLWLGPSAEQLADLGAGAAYPRLGGEVPDEDRPKLQLTADRGADAVEQEPDPQDQTRIRDEVLGLSLFTTAGTLESGRATFVDLDCPSDPADCPQRLRSQVTAWQPPAAAAALEAPDGRAYFFAVLRDDRGGVAVRSGVARAQP